MLLMRQHVIEYSILGGVKAVSPIDIKMKNMIGISQ